MLTYKSAGVDLDVYAESMARLPGLVSRTFSDRVMRLDGGFAGLFSLFGGDKRYTAPVLVSCTDGVGTKLKVACMAGRHSTVGIDLVAMSVNDAICCGAEPLFFLDYVAMPKDAPDLLEQIVSGIVAGCVDAGAALIGGETAILPDIYQAGDYDLAGFCVGVAERDKIIDGRAIRKGDVAIALPSSGLHSNGYSLARKIVLEAAGLQFDSYVDELGQTVADVLLEPTRIYVKLVKELLASFDANVTIHGIAHITGGGLVENVSRLLKGGLKLSVTENSWQVPKVFEWLERTGNVESGEMARVFNMGVGLVLLVERDKASEIEKFLDTKNEKYWVIGEIV
ncbi:MAG: phosphoribosylformylglycinamidine cyclo-ligase [Planctomycetaceae bacterium]|jgi:phosphoribosylformylglycinamidine cyclo-ligase|nr:phosphoribosylformylglycinamidine cyclo-ligase [Planctomycetaceae bacterium]